MAGKLITINVAGKWTDSQRKEWNSYTYSPTDTPDAIYLSEDAARAVAGMEHGIVRFAGDKAAANVAPRKRRDREENEDETYRRFSDSQGAR